MTICAIYYSANGEVVSFSLKSMSWSLSTRVQVKVISDPNTTVLLLLVSTGEDGDGTVSMQVHQSLKY